MRLGSAYINPSGIAYDLVKARTALEKAIELDPQYAAPHNWMSELYRLQGRKTEEAREKAALPRVSAAW